MDSSFFSLAEKTHIHTKCSRSVYSAFKKNNNNKRSVIYLWTNSMRLLIPEASWTERSAISIIDLSFST